MHCECCNSLCEEKDVVICVDCESAICPNCNISNYADMPCCEECGWDTSGTDDETNVCDECFDERYEEEVFPCDLKNKEICADCISDWCKKHCNGSETCCLCDSYVDEYEGVKLDW